MDGIWNAGVWREQTKQAELTKHRLLRINLSNTGLLLPGDASSYGSLSPVAVASPVANVLSSGPHFTMSSITPDNSHTYGFEYCFSTIETIPVTAPVTRAAPPYTVTIWALVGTSVIQDSAGSFSPIWAAMLPVTGVGNNELWHSFDVNASAIRFQITDATVSQATSRSLTIAFSEL